MTEPKPWFSDVTPYPEHYTEAELHREAISQALRWLVRSVFESARPGAEYAGDFEDQIQDVARVIAKAPPKEST